MRPFSHLAGVKYPVPFSNFGVQIFPAAIIVQGNTIPLKVEGPVLGFTSMLDLERGVIQVFGTAKSGYFRYFLFSLNGNFAYFQDRGEPIFPNEYAQADRLPSLKEGEKISFGFSKALDFELVKRRLNWGEVLPVWFKLGQMMPKGQIEQTGDCLFKTFIQSKGLELKESFWNFFSSGFSGIFHPESHDASYLGFNMCPSQDAFTTLHEGYKKIRSLIILEKSGVIEILPEILPLFVHGRAIRLQTSFGFVDLEWTKGMLRQMMITCKTPSSIELHFPKNHKKCRLESSAKLKLSLDLNCTLDLRKDTQYCLSHFQE